MQNDNWGKYKNDIAWIVLATGCIHFEYSVHFGLDNFFSQIFGKWIRLKVILTLFFNTILKCIVISINNQQQSERSEEKLNQWKWSWHSTKGKVSGHSQSLRSLHFLNRLRVRWKSDTATARQTNAFISHSQYIILGDHFGSVYCSCNKVIDKVPLVRMPCVILRARHQL